MDIKDLADLAVKLRDKLDELPVNDDDKKRLRELLNRAIKRLALVLVGATS